MEDPFGFIEAECHVTPSQEHTLSHTPFARDNSGVFSGDDNAGDSWPVFSSSGESSAGNNNNDVVGITICSIPSTPESNEVAGPTVVTLGNSGDAGGEGFVNPGERKREREDSLVAALTAPAKRVKVCGVEDDGGEERESVAELGGGTEELNFYGDDGGDDEVVAEERDGERENSAPVAKKLNYCDVVEVVEDESGEERGNEVEFGGDTEKLSFDGDVDDEVVEEETKRKRERSPLRLKMEEGVKVDVVVVEDESGEERENVLESVYESEEERENVVELDGGDTEKLNFEDGVKDEVVEGEREEIGVNLVEEASIGVAGSCGGRNLGCGSGLKSRSKSESSGGSAMECLIEMLRILRESNGKGKEESVDILETAKSRGMTFPRNRAFDS